MPTNTSALKYNTYYHRYVLNVEHLKTNLGVDFITSTGSKTKADNLCLQISNRIYNYIYNHKQRSKTFWEWFLAFDTEVKTVIQKALEQQAIFEYNSNASQLQNQLGINLLNGTKFSLEDLRGERGISLEAINELRFYKDGILLFTGKEIYLPTSESFNYTDLGY